MEDFFGKKGYQVDLKGLPRGVGVGITPTELKPPRSFHGLITRPSFLQYIGRTNYSDVEKILFYSGRYGYEKDPALSDTVIKVIGGETFFSIEVGGMEVFDKEANTYPDDRHLLYSYEPVHKDSPVNALRAKIRNFLGVKDKRVGREDWVEDFLEMVYPRYNRPGRDMRVKLPEIPLRKNQRHFNVGTIGHVDHRKSPISHFVHEYKASDSITLVAAKHHAELLAYPPKQQTALKELETLVQGHWLDIETDKLGKSIGIIGHDPDTANLGLFGFGVDGVLRGVCLVNPWADRMSDQSNTDTVEIPWDKDSDLKD